MKKRIIATNNQLKRVIKKATAVVLSTMILVCAMPMTVFADTSAGADSGEHKHTVAVADVNGKEYVSDSNTLDSWKNQFSPNSTEYAGFVWTDKTVLTRGTDGLYTAAGTSKVTDFDGLKAAQFDKENSSFSDPNNASIVMKYDQEKTISIDEENFLVAMSAMGATKEITGYSALPSDTVLVLDLSNSMDKDAMYAMVEATNKAIQKLLDLNKHNRVGVAVYASEAYQLLPIDKYTTTSTATDDNGTPNNTSDDTTYPEYIRLENFSRNEVWGGATNTGEIVTPIGYAGTTSVTHKVDISGITAEEWNTISSEASKKYQNNRRRGEAIKNAMISAGAVIPSQITISWSNVADDKSNNTTWEQHIKSKLYEYINTGVTVNTTNYTGLVKNSKNEEMKATVEVGGGTYIQGGLGIAKAMFKNISDTAIETGLIQGGTKRMPIIVLMSDGAPTFGTTNYTMEYGNAVLDANGKIDMAKYAEEVNDDSNIGSGNTTDENDVFPTQLTAAYLAKTVEEHYDNEGLFYTLGLNVGNNTYARMVLDPKNNTSDTLNGFWTAYENTTTNRAISGYNNGGDTITRKESASDTLTTYKTYVTYDSDGTKGYFAASGAEGLINAFENIVDKIVIQSRYYPTLAEDNQFNLGGYITIEDEIGAFMEVKEVEGLVIGNHIYTGAAFLEAIAINGLFGSASKYTPYGNELLKSIAERIGIREDQAGTLLADAWRTGVMDDPNTTNVNEGRGQLKTDNFIGWYADESGNYIGSWDDINHTPDNYPQNAKYINKSYLFQGELSEAYGEIRGADMMHIVFQVHTEIATGNQSVIWKIPASLIPLLTYKISVNSSSIESATEIKMSSNYNKVEPIRVLFEVGLQDRINDITMHEIVGKAEHNHAVVDTNDNVIGYAFYSNRWGSGYVKDGSGSTDMPDPYGDQATVAHFNPSTANERYFYTEDSIIYEDANGTDAYEHATTPPSGSGYYHPYQMFVISGENTDPSVEKTATRVNKEIPIAENVLAGYRPGDKENSTIWKTDDNKWYVKAGQIYEQLTRHRLLKDNNYTGTIGYYDYPMVTKPSATNNDYSVHTFHGNNGRLVKYSTQGIRLTKNIDVVSTENGATHVFNFTVAFSEAQPNMKVLDENGNPLAEGRCSALSLNNATNKYEFTISNVTEGEVIYITGLTTGTVYEVTEADHNNYRIKSVSVNNNAETGTTASDTVENYTIDEVVFVNTASSHKGDLLVEKKVRHPYGDDYIINPDLEFEIIVDLGTSVANKQYVITGTGEIVTVEGSTLNETAVVSGNTYTTDTNGKYTFKLKHDDSVIIKDLPEGTTYTITENLGTDSPWILENAQGVNIDSVTGTIVSDTMQEAYLYNNLENTKEIGVDNADINITKIIAGWENHTDWTFGFKVEKYNPDATAEADRWTTITATIGEATKVAPTVVISGSTASGVKFGKNDVGKTYYYRIGEIQGNISGVTYDNTNRYFSITITDENTDGTPELTVNEYSGVTVTKDSSGKYTVNTTFTNYYNSVVADVTLKKNLTNYTGVDVLLNEFTFKVECDCTGECTDNNHKNNANLKVNANGDLTFPLIWKISLSDITTANGWVPTQPPEGTTGKTGTENTEGATGTENTEGIEGGVSSIAVSTPSNEVTYTKTYTYYLSEVAGSMPGMSYDGAKYKVEVTLNAVVTTPSEGAQTLTVTAAAPVYTKLANSTPATDDVDTIVTSVVFDNTYKLSDNAVVVNVPVSKTLDGRNILDGDNFTFELYKANSVFEIVESTKVTKVINGDGTSNTGTATFNLLNGAADAEDKTDSNNDGKPDNFIQAGTYYYVIKETAGTNPAITYDPATYHITVVVDRNDTVENNSTVFGDKLVVKSVTVNKVGGVITTYPTDSLGNISVAFTNKYTVGETTIDLEGVKTLSGKKIETDEFKFNLYKADGTTLICENVSAAAVSGKFVFEDIETYTHPGTYTYVVKENIPSGANNNIVTDYNGITGSKMEYDSNACTVVVTVTDDGKGNLNAAITSVQKAGNDENGIVFNNKFTPASVKVTFSGNKAYVDETNAPIQTTWPSFEFELIKTNDTFTANNGSETISLNADKTFGKTMEYDKATTEYFILKEKDTGLSSVIYDAKEYHITVIVTDYGTGVLSPAISVTCEGNPVNAVVEDSGNNITFKNVFDEQVASTRVSINKVFENPTSIDIPMDSFQFGVYTKDSNGNYVEYKDVNDVHITAKAVNNGTGVGNVSNGTAKIELSFTNEGMTGGNIVDPPILYIKEISGTTDDVNGVTYDKSVFEVDVTLSYDAAGKFVAQNTIKQVVDSNGAAISSPTVVTSDAIGFTNGINLDKDKDTIAIEGTKNLDGKTLEKGDFQFNIYSATVDADGNWTRGTIVDNVINGSSAVNEDASRFKFKTFEYTSADAGKEFYYIVKEVDGGRTIKGVTYDDAEYRVTVKVELKAADDDNLVNDIIATATYQKVTKVNNNSTVTNADEIVFNNKYAIDPNAMVEIDIDIIKNLILASTGTHGLSGFEFRLVDTTNGANIPHTVKSDADGKATIKLTFNHNATGTYTYTLSETNQGEANMEYDTRTFNFVIAVEDNGEGGLIATVEQNGQQVAVIGDGNTANDTVSAQFNNTYKGAKYIPEEPVEEKETVTVIVNTGDTNNNNLLYAGLMALSAACFSLVLFFMKKRKDEEDEAEA